MKGDARRFVPWLSSEDACVLLGYVYPCDIVRGDEVVHRAGEPNLPRFHKFVQRHRPKASKLGARLRFRQTDLEACLEPVKAPRERRAPLRVVGGRGR